MNKNNKVINNRKPIDYKRDSSEDSEKGFLSDIDSIELNIEQRVVPITLKSIKKRTKLSLNENNCLKLITLSLESLVKMKEEFNTLSICIIETFGSLDSTILPNNNPIKHVVIKDRKITIEAVFYEMDFKFPKIRRNTRTRIIVRINNCNEIIILKISPISAIMEKNILNNYNNNQDNLDDIFH